MLNSCEFIGNLGRDPEVRTFQNGGKVCNLNLACTEKWTKDGERKEKTEWISVAVFGDGLVRVCEQYLRKGSKVYLRGKFTTRKWQDQSGNDRYSSEIVLQGPDAKMVMLDGPSQGGGQDRAQSGGYDQGGSHGGYGGGSTGGAGGVGDIEDEIPFIMEWRI